MWLAVTYLLALFGFFTQYVYPLANPTPAAAWQPTGSPVTALGGQGRVYPLDYAAEAPMLAGFLFYSVVLTATVLVGLRIARPPVGALSLVIGASTAAMVFLRSHYLADFLLPVLLMAGISAGVVADMLWACLRPDAGNRWRIFLFAGLTPALACTAYFAALWVAGGVWWTVHLWTGAIVLAGALGALTAVVANPPPPHAVGVVLPILAPRLPRGRQS